MRWSKTYKQLTFGATFALTAVKLQIFSGKTHHVWQLLEHVFFSCSHLDATDSITSILM